MDPQATLNELLAAVESREWDRVDELSEALLEWMQRGGFPPQTLGSQKLGKQWHRAVATFVCHAAASKSRDAAKRRRRREEADAAQ